MDSTLVYPSSALPSLHYLHDGMRSCLKSTRLHGDRRVLRLEHDTQVASIEREEEALRAKLSEVEDSHAAALAKKLKRFQDLISGLRTGRISAQLEVLRYLQSEM